MTPHVTPSRLLDQLDRLARIGGRPDGGVDRVAGSAADVEARRWVAARMGEAGLEPELDELGTVLGLAPGPRPWLLLGSHTDTVPAGGRLDGAYGVVAALEVARALRHPRLAVVDFADEEGVTGGGLAGSGRFCHSPRIASVLGYLELHVEQGPRLESEGLELGAVEGIVGIERWDLVITGAANHAGTTPLDARRDAGAAAGAVMAALPELLRAAGPDLVGNIGDVRLEPGAPNVVPGAARLVVELRAPAVDSIERAAAAVRVAAEAACARRGCSLSLERSTAVAPVRMDARLVEVIARCCARSGRPWRRLASGAGHDAGVMALHVPAGMLFVPSRGGVSHHPAEYTEPAHLALGTQVLLEATLAAFDALEKPSS